MDNQKWYTQDGSLPIQVDRRFVPAAGLFDTEKEALAEAKKHGQEARERYQQMIDTLDARIDALELAEVESE